MSDDERRKLADGEAVVCYLKPLAWRHLPMSDGREVWAADTVLCDITVEYDPDDGCHWRYCVDEFYDEDNTRCDSVADGKAQAEAWYFGRIAPAVQMLPPDLTARQAFGLRLLLGDTDPGLLAAAVDALQEAGVIPADQVEMVRKAERERCAAVADGEADDFRRANCYPEAVGASKAANWIRRMP